MTSAPISLSSEPVSALVSWARERMERAGVDSPWLTALVLLEHVAGVDREAALAHPESRLPPARAAEFSQLVERRSLRQPLAYILGYREFYGRRFSVTPDTLIPRPETEGIVDLALDRMKRWETRREEHGPEGSGSRPGASRLLDVGTGSGAIAVTLLACRPRWKAVATDTNLAALGVARGNAIAHGVAGRLSLVACHLAHGVRTAFPLVIANLPYVPSAQVGALEPEIAEYEPRCALDGGPDGTVLITAFLESVPALLTPGGTALLEIGDGQAHSLRARARKILPQCEVAVVRDTSRAERFLVIENPFRVPSASGRG